MMVTKQPIPRAKPSAQLGASEPSLGAEPSGFGASLMARAYHGDRALAAAPRVYVSRGARSLQKFAGPLRRRSCYSGISWVRTKAEQVVAWSAWAAHGG